MHDTAMNQTISVQEVKLLLVTLNDSKLNDEAIIAQLWQELKGVIEHIAGSANSMIVINWKQVKFVSSATQSMLLGLRRCADKHRVKIVFCCVHPNILDALEITKINEKFEIHVTQEQAIAALLTP